jgi:hypothetical protein
MTKEDLSANNGQGRCGRCTTHAQCTSAQRCVKEALPASATPSPYKRAAELDTQPGAELKLRGQEFTSVVVDELDTFPALGELPVHTIGAGRPLGIRGEDAPRPEFVTNLGEWVPPSALEPSRYDGDERLDERTPGFVRLPKADTFPALGELPVHDNAKPADPERFASHCPAHDSRCAPDACVLDTIGAGRPRGFAPIPFKLTPKAEAELDALLLEGDAIQQQLRPPPVPEVTTMGFKVPFVLGLLVASGAIAALPYIVEMFK